MGFGGSEGVKESCDCGGFTWLDFVAIFEETHDDWSEQVPAHTVQQGAAGAQVRELRTIKGRVDNETQGIDMKKGTTGTREKQNETQNMVEPPPLGMACEVLAWTWPWLGHGHNA